MTDTTPQRVTYIFPMDHRLPDKGDRQDQGADHERHFQDETVVRLIAQIKKQNPNADFVIVAPDGLSNTSKMPDDVTVIALAAKDGETREDFYKRYDNAITTAAQAARINGKVVGISPHYDAIVHADSITEETVKAATILGGSHVVVDDDKTSEKSHKLAEKIAHNAVNAALGAGFQPKTKNGSTQKVASQQNITLDKHSAEFDSIALVEIAAQNDAVGHMLQSKGVALTPAFSGVPVTQPAGGGKGGPGYSAQVMAYSRWLQAGSPSDYMNASAISDADKTELAAIEAKGVSLTQIPALTAQYVDDKGILSGIATAATTHVSQDLGVSAAATQPAPQAPATPAPTQRTQPTPAAPSTSSTPATPPSGGTDSEPDKNAGKSNKHGNSANRGMTGGGKGFMEQAGGFLRDYGAWMVPMIMFGLAMMGFGLPALAVVGILGLFLVASAKMGGGGDHGPSPDHRVHPAPRPRHKDRDRDRSHGRDRGDDQDHGQGRRSRRHGRNQREPEYADPHSYNPYTQPGNQYRIHGQPVPDAHQYNPYTQPGNEYYILQQQQQPQPAPAPASGYYAGRNAALEEIMQLQGCSDITYSPGTADTGNFSATGLPSPNAGQQQNACANVSGSR